MAASSVKKNMLYKVSFVLFVLLGAGAAAEGAVHARGGDGVAPSPQQTDAHAADDVRGTAAAHERFLEEPLHRGACQCVPVETDQSARPLLDVWELPPRGLLLSALEC